MSADLDPLEGARWETIGWIEVDAGTVAFADGSLLELAGDVTERLVERLAGTWDVRDATGEGYPLVAFNTIEDGTVPG